MHVARPGPDCPSSSDPSCTAVLATCTMCERNENYREERQEERREGGREGGVVQRGGEGREGRGLTATG
jgi:hypothetical protein